LGHGLGDGAHRDGGLDARGNGVDARRQSEERDALVRITDRSGGVEAGDLGLGRIGSERLFHLGLFGARVAVAASSLAVELLAGELEEGELGGQRRNAGVGVLRDKLI
jgi:hypothetical protein